MIHLKSTSALRSTVVFFKSQCLCYDFSNIYESDVIRTLDPCASNLTHWTQKVSISWSLENKYYNF